MGPEGRFRLTINREKTRVVKMHQPEASLNFLGFTFRYEQDLFGRNRRCLRVEPSRKAEQRLREKVREQTGPQWGWMPLPSLLVRLNQTLRGWCAHLQRHGLQFPTALERPVYASRGGYTSNPTDCTG